VADGGAHARAAEVAGEATYQPRGRDIDAAAESEAPRVVTSGRLMTEMALTILSCSPLNCSHFECSV